MRTVTAAVLTQHIDASSRDIENWIPRLAEKLSTSYHQPDRGKPRQLSRVNARELGIIAGLVRGGATPSHAAIFTKVFMRALRTPGTLNPPREWFVFAAGNLTKGKSTDQPNVAAIQKELNATTLSLVHIGEIIRRVDKLFECE